MEDRLIGAARDFEESAIVVCPTLIGCSEDVAQGIERQAAADVRI